MRFEKQQLNLGRQNLQPRMSKLLATKRRRMFYLPKWRFYLAKVTFRPSKAHRFYLLKWRFYFQRCRFYLPRWMFYLGKVTALPSKAHILKPKMEALRLKAQVSPSKM